MFRKTMMMAAAVGVLGAIASPMAASASWKHHSTSIQTDVQIGLTGNIRKQGGLGGYECQVTMRMKLLAGQTTATAETFVPHPTSDTANCRGLGGLAFCQIHNLTPQAPNWTAHTVQSPVSVTITTQEITSTLTGSFCPIKHIRTTPGTITLTPNQANTVSSFTASGSFQVHLETQNLSIDTETMQLGGTLNVESPNANTYSI